MEKKKNVKKIEFRINLEGKGIVNFDDDSIRKFAYSYDELSHLRTNFKNVKYAKRNLIENSDGSVTPRLKISSNAIRYHLFRDVNPAQSPNIIHNEYLLYSFIGSPEMIMRGYMFTSSDAAIKKKSALTITDAEQTCGAKSKMDFFTRSGEKLNKVDESSVSDTSIFKIETVGDIKYTADGVIDLQELQFLSGDDIYDRTAFNPDYFENVFTPFLEKRIPNFNSKLDYYMLDSSLIRVPEYGFNFSDENVLFMVKNMLKRLLSLNINKNNAFTKIESLDIRIVNDPIGDINSDWTNIKSESDVDKIDFTVQQYYTLATEEETSNRPLMDDIKKEVAKVNKAKSELKKKDKAKNNTKKK